MVLLFAVALADGAAAQCTTSWLPGLGAPGIAGAFGAGASAATLWDPDGVGPLPQRLVVGGDFVSAAGVAAHNIAAYDFATGTWSALGTGTDGAVHALLARPNGELIVGGSFTTAGGVAVANIARWTAGGWSALGGSGGGVGGGAVLPGVRALATLPNGDLLVGGHFVTAGGLAVNNIARWNGAAWSALGSGTDDTVLAMTVTAVGDVVVGGWFGLAGGVAASRIARWNGAAWSAMGSGVGSVPFNPVFVSAVVTLPNNDVAAAGCFLTMGGVNATNVARWNGVAWSAVGAGVGSGVYLNGEYVETLLPLPNGDLVAGGTFHGGSGSPNGVARWNGASWIGLGGGVQYTGFLSAAQVACLTLTPSADLLVGGLFDRAGTIQAEHLAVWDGTSWGALSAGPDHWVWSLVRRPNGDVIAGGDFTRLWGVPAANIARHDGAGWSAMSTSTNGRVQALAVAPNGDVLAGGTFFTIGGVAASRIARWNGSAWAPLGAGFNNTVRAIAVLSNGHVVAGGDFQTMVSPGVTAWRIAEWNGTSWTTMGSGTSDRVYALAVMPNGDVVAAGDFATAGGVPCSRIARWNGSVWAPLGAGLNTTVYCLQVMPNGHLIAGGQFWTAGGAPANRIARWDGSTWSPLGGGMDGDVTSLGLLPTGELVAGGRFANAGGAPATRIARWNGTSWSSFGSGMPGFGTEVSAFATMPAGDLVVGGGFATAGAVTTSNLAQLTTSCPAEAVSYGSACGPHVLTAQSLPWLGTTFATQTTCTSPCIPVMVTGGAQASVPLALLYPQGLPGCNLLVTPDILTVVTPIFGQVFGYVALPNTPSLAGLSFYQQVVEVRLDLTGAFTQLASTNALEVTIGSY